MQALNSVIQSLCIKMREYKITNAQFFFFYFHIVFISLKNDPIKEIVKPCDDNKVLQNLNVFT